MVSQRRFTRICAGLQLQRRWLARICTCGAHTFPMHAIAPWFHELAMHGWVICFSRDDTTLILLIPRVESIALLTPDLLGLGNVIIPAFAVRSHNRPSLPHPLNQQHNKSKSLAGLIGPPILRFFTRAPLGGLSSLLCTTMILLLIYWLSSFMRLGRELFQGYSELYQHKGIGSSASCISLLLLCRRCFLSGHA